MTMKNSFLLLLVLFGMVFLMTVEASNHYDIMRATTTTTRSRKTTTTAFVPCIQQRSSTKAEPLPLDNKNNNKRKQGATSGATLLVPGRAPFGFQASLDNNNNKGEEEEKTMTTTTAAMMLGGERDDDNASETTPSGKKTFFGLEPKENIDPLDNGLTFLGPIIVGVQLYVMYELVFGDVTGGLDSAGGPAVF